MNIHAQVHYTPDLTPQGGHAPMDIVRAVNRSRNASARAAQIYKCSIIENAVCVSKFSALSTVSLSPFFENIHLKPHLS